MNNNNLITSTTTETMDKHKMSPLIPPSAEPIPPLGGSMIGQQVREVKNVLGLPEDGPGTSGATMAPLSNVNLQEVSSIDKLLPIFGQDPGRSNFPMVPGSVPAGIDVIKEFLTSSSSGAHMATTSESHMVPPTPNQMAASIPPATTHSYSTTIAPGSSTLPNISANPGQSIAQRALSPLGSSDVGQIYSSQPQRPIKHEAPTSTSTDDLTSALFIKNPVHVLPPCKVCGQKGTGFHYGVNTCEPCKVRLSGKQVIFSILFLNNEYGMCEKKKKNGLKSMPKLMMERFGSNQIPYDFI